MKLAIPTLKFMIRSNLLPEISICQLSYLTRELNLAYKKYWRQIPPLTIYSDEIDDILTHERIIKYHKYRTHIEYFFRDCNEDHYFFSQVSNPYFLRHYVRVLLDTSCCHVLSSMLLTGNIKGCIQLCRSVLQYYPDLNASPVKRIFGQYRSLFYIVDVRLDLPIAPNLGWLSQIPDEASPEDMRNIINTLYEKFSQQNWTFRCVSDFCAFFCWLLKFGSALQIKQMLEHEHFPQIQLTLTLVEYNKLPTKIQALLSSYITFGHRRPQSYHIFVDVGYNDWNTYLSDVPQYVEEWFDSTSNEHILADICQNHFSTIYQRDYSTPYKFKNPTLIQHIANQTDIAYLSIFPTEFANVGILDITYMKTWVSAVSAYHSDFQSCLNHCFWWTLWHTLTDERRQLLSYLLELCVSWPARNYEFPNLNAYLDVYHLDALLYLLDHNYQFTYDDVCLLYLSLGRDCQTYPRTFKTVVSRMRRTYMPLQY